MDNIKLYKGDCLEVMDKLIKEGVKVDVNILDDIFNNYQPKQLEVVGNKNEEEK